MHSGKCTEIYIPFRQTPRPCANWRRSTIHGYADGMKFQCISLRFEMGKSSAIYITLNASTPSHFPDPVSIVKMAPSIFAGPVACSNRPGGFPKNRAKG